MEALENFTPVVHEGRIGIKLDGKPKWVALHSLQTIKARSDDDIAEALP